MLQFGKKTNKVLVRKKHGLSAIVLRVFTGTDCSHPYISGETLECRTDSEERLQGLEDEASDRQNPDQYPLDPPSRDEAKAAGAGLSSLFNLDDLGDISIQLITLVSCALPLSGVMYNPVLVLWFMVPLVLCVWFSF